MTHTRTLANSAPKALALLAVCLAAASMPLAFTGPAVALSAIHHALGGSPVALLWITNAFMLAFGGSLMAGGALADRYGRKRLFLIGVFGFAVTATGLAFAPDILSFDLLRAAQGVFGAAAFSGGMAALAQEFDGAARIRAFSLVGASFGGGLAFGPVASGALIDAFGWPAIFVLVIALTVPAFVLGRACLHETRDPDAGDLDWPGALTFTLALTLFTGAVLQAPALGWGSRWVIGALIGAALLFAMFVAIERRSQRPMLDLSLFHYPRFVGVQLLAAAPAYGFVVLLILLPARFIGVEGMSAVEGGRMMMALSAPLLVLPVAVSFLTRWLTPGALCGFGLLVSAAGLLWLSGVPVGSSAVETASPMLLIGLGVSLPWGLMDGLAVSVVPKERAGMATGIFSTTRVAGEGVALAVVSALLSAFIASHLTMAGTLSAPDAAIAAQRLVTGDLAEAARALPGVNHAALVHAYDQAFRALLWLLSAITGLTAVVVVLFLRQGEEEAAVVTAPAQ